MITELDLAAWHEAGHAVAAHQLGRQLGPLAVLDSGRGCALYCRPQVAVAVPDVGLPLAAWPVAWQRWATAETLVLLAGDISEGLFGDRPAGRVVDAVATVAQEIVTGQASSSTPPTATAAEREQVAGVLADDPARTDADAIAHTAWIAHGGDPLRAGRWIAWLAEEARALLLVRESRVRRLAALLEAERTVGAEAAARVLAEPC